MSRKVKWLGQPDAEDFPKAANYLHLLVNDGAVDATVGALEAAPLTHQKAKDILRASGLPLLDAADPHVATYLKQIRDGVRLSPILLVRGNLPAGVPLHIADGYHRVCATYLTDENTDIPVRLADLTL
ncbi:hypothetical protein [Cryobacterium fucosi]|uniref:ParB/Sulfiredoxin domain-containing protein n=1 Tax=Cryobacterium fucosi TaxID=1259157 RepID=A0A4R9B697_9MICO|nr:hypothetical protein [Cryobacterium fucosi]TFD76958.1 hypothetical protein E3T48_09415 [Cryobacterium fucosi]